MIHHLALVVLLVSGLTVMGGFAGAAIPQVPVNHLLNDFLPEGSFRGGVAGAGFSLIGVKRVFSTSGNSERIILEIGNKEGKPFVGKASYFHAQLFRNPSVLNIDLPQILQTKFTETHLKGLLKKSKLIEETEMATDLSDQSTNLSMKFRRAVKVRMFTLSPKKASPKLVIDISKL